MKEYLDLVELVLEKGIRKHNRTGVDTVSYFGANYKVDLSKGFPLLTTKKMQWKSILHEVLWYFSGEDHIRNLQRHTKIWDNWADEYGQLETAYGYYWRHFPHPKGKIHVNGQKYQEIEYIDQIQYVIDEIKRNPDSRRLVVTAWEPGNAITSKLPPCHYTFCFNVSEGKLSCHLTQRSGDIALGIPFNLAAYAIITQMIAQETGLEVGYFSHTIVDAHIYVDDSPEKKYNHVPGLIEQLKRAPMTLPKLIIAKKPINDLTFNDFELRNYASHPAIKFEVTI